MNYDIYTGILASSVAIGQVPSYIVKLSCLYTILGVSFAGFCFKHILNIFMVELWLQVH